MYFLVFIYLISFKLYSEDSLQFSYDRNMKHEFMGKGVLYKTEYTLNNESYINIYYPNGILREYYFLINDTLTNQIGWYNNGIKSYEYNYVNGKVQGIVKRYYENGKLKAIQHYTDGFLNGKEYWYNQNGKLEFVRNYINGNEVTKH